MRLQLRTPNEIYCGPRLLHSRLRLRWLVAGTLACATLGQQLV